MTPVDRKHYGIVIQITIVCILLWLLFLRYSIYLHHTH
jgi:hypothetical protein